MKKLKVSLLSISFIFFLFFIVYLTNNYNLFYQFIDSNYIQHILPKYFNSLKTYLILVTNINYHENQIDSPPQNQIKNLVSVGKISINNITSKILNQTLYHHNNASQYVFSKNKSEIHTPEKNKHYLEFEKSKMVLVKPTFTDAAYHHAFYIFYKMYVNVTVNTNVTSNLDLRANYLLIKKDQSLMYMQCLIFYKI